MLLLLELAQMKKESTLIDLNKYLNFIMTYQSHNITV